MLDSHNPHVKAFRSAHERFNIEDGSEGLRLMLPSESTTNARTHNLPTSKEVAALIPGDFTAGVNKRNIVIESRSGNLQQISELHPVYLPLQYPLFFPYGEDGYRLGIDIGFVDTRGRKRKTVTMREFYAYRVFERYEESSIIVMAGKLLQQFLVDAFTTIESNRLNYIWMNKSKLRTETVDKITEAAEKGHGYLAQHRKKIYIPSSFTGGKRYMMQHYLDAMATCKYYGFPDLFITFTCNPRWSEIDRYLQRHRLSKEDRPDICSRVFKMKLDRLLDQVTKEKTFGIINSTMNTIEFQKRGLPHAHMILFLHPDNKMRTTDDIDKFISAEIPDKEVDKYLYEVVPDVIIHCPCGPMNKDSVCMNNGKCTKFFPKPYMDNTIVDDASYPIYRRRNDGRVVEKRVFQYDNSYVIPYNCDLSLRFRAHINVEWCNQTCLVKHLFKYITKGPDYVRANVGGEDQENEIKKVFQLQNKKEKLWKPRSEKRKIFAIGRITYVPPSVGQAYYLRVLLNKILGPTSFDYVKTVNGVLYKDFQEACYALGLLDDDKEYIAAINEAGECCKVLKLTENLRLRKASNSMDVGALATFSKWLLDIGNGKINESNSGDVEIEIPNDLLINTSGNPIEAIIKEIYGEHFATRTDPKFFSERAILSPRNDDVDKINQFMLTKLPCMQIK
ncbi:PREDICTED: uncharacterized protein LOC109126890 [Camelina sativa]|uniref:ATP-dependent DNA helicase n=1 Tax=Camelina sativa TaxID=90675 RepID=A0ABM1QHU3_CAMSA|nr:PREDICTED: uncharacterized protein LOC109126890 [Camelina sativa]